MVFASGANGIPYISMNWLICHWGLVYEPFAPLGAPLRAHCSFRPPLNTLLLRFITELERLWQLPPNCRSTADPGAATSYYCIHRLAEMIEVPHTCTAQPRGPMMTRCHRQKVIKQNIFQVSILHHFVRLCLKVFSYWMPPFAYLKRTIQNTSKKKNCFDLSKQLRKFGGDIYICCNCLPGSSVSVLS